MDKRKIIIVVSGIAIIAFSYFSMMWLSGMKRLPPKQPPKEVVRFVKADVIEYSNHDVSILANGRVISNADVTLIAEVRGALITGDVSFMIGESFKKGDLLVKIDDSIELNNMKSRKSSFLNRI